MSNEIVKVYYPDSGNNVQFAYCETRGSFLQFVENINSFVGRLDMMPQSFEEDFSGQRYRMYWIDEDNDKVLINSDYSLRIFLARTNGIKKVYIEEKDNPPTNSTQHQTQYNQPQQQLQQSPTSSAAPSGAADAAVHERVQCDNCDAKPIVGFRYKCAQCYDYDLCEKCEQKKVHPDHVMYRFPVPLPRHTDLNRRFFKKMRHGCFGRPADAPEEGDQQRQRRCGRRRHESHNNGAGRSSAPGAFNQFYTMMCDLAEGMDSQDIQNAASGTASAPPQEPEAAAKKARPSNAASTADNSDANQSDAPSAGNNSPEDEVPLLFPGIDPIYARAGVEALKGFSEIFGKLLDPLGITVDVDVGLKGDNNKNGQQPNASKPKAAESEQPATAAPQNNAATSTATQQPETLASGTQTPIIDLDSPASTSASIAPISDDTNESVSAAVGDSALTTDGIRVFPSDASQQTASNQEKAMEVDADEAAGNYAVASNKKRGSSPIEASWTVIEKQFVDLRVDGQAEGSGENQPISSTDSQSKQPSAPQSVDYSQLSKDLLSHIQAEERAKHQQDEQQQQQRRPDPRPVASVVHHPDKKINNAVIAMTAMGFSNEGGWLTNLLETVDGDIPRALELLHPSR